MYSNIPSGRIYAQCSKCERLFPVNIDGKSIIQNCKLHKVKKGKCRDCGSTTPFKSQDFDHNCYHTTKNLVPAQFFDCRFRVFFLFFISQGIASND